MPYQQHRCLPAVFILCILLGSSLLGEATPSFAQTPWHNSLVRDGGGWWSARIPLTITNSTKLDVLGEPLFLHIGNAKNELPLVGVEAGSLRVCDATGNEMLYRISDPNGETVASGPIPQGSELSIPVECKAEITCKYYVYFDNPRAMPSPEFLKGKGRLANSDIEKGSDRTPFGWEQDQGDPTHQVEWSREESHSGQHSLKTTVAEKAEPSWIATRQNGIYVQPGARYEFRAWVKGKSTKGTVGWYLHIGNEKKSQMRNLMLNAGDGTFDWKEIHAEFTVPDDANTLNLGTVLRGTGTAWYDDAKLTLLESPQKIDITAAIEPVERLQLQKIGTHDWATETLPGYDYRLVVDAINTTDQAQKNPLLQVNINSLVARYGRFLNLDAVRILCDGKPVRFYRLADAILIDDNLPARSVKSYQLYFTTDPDAKAMPETDYAALVMSRFNMLKNGSFEKSIQGSKGIQVPASWDGATNAKPPIVMEQTKNAAPGLGQFAARLEVPQGQTTNWRGWTQWIDLHLDPPKVDEAVMPRTYFFSGYLMSHHLRKVEKVDDDMFDPQAEASLGYARLHLHFHDQEKMPCKKDWSTSIGEAVADSSNEWKLLQGNISPPNDAAFIGVHLTMDCTGELLHDGIFFGQVVPITASPHLQRRHDNQQQEVVVWPVNAIRKVFTDDFLPVKAAPAKVSLARNEKEPLQMAVRSTVAAKGVHVVVDPPVGPGGAKLDDIEVGVVGYVPVDYPTGYYNTRTDRWRVKYPNTPPICDGWPGLWPDPILPTNQLDLKPGKNPTDLDHVWCEQVDASRRVPWKNLSEGF